MLGKWNLFLPKVERSKLCCPNVCFKGWSKSWKPEDLRHASFAKLALLKSWTSLSLCLSAALPLCLSAFWKVESLLHLCLCEFCKTSLFEKLNLSASLPLCLSASLPLCLLKSWTFTASLPVQVLQTLLFWKVGPLQIIRISQRGHIQPTSVAKINTLTFLE